MGWRVSSLTLPYSFLLSPRPPSAPLFPYTTLFRSMQGGGRNEPLDRPPVDGRRLDRERLEAQAAPPQAHLAPAPDPRGGVTGHERVAKHPVDVQSQTRDRAGSRGMAAQSARERQRIKERA